MFNNELFLLRFGKYMKQLLSIKEKALKIVKSVRGSTAAGINISLLPRDCSCEEFACSAVWGRDLSPGICGIWLIRYRKGPPGVRNMHSVRRTASCGTRRIFRGTRCKKQAFLVQE